MERVYIKDIKNYVEETVKIAGFVQAIRGQSKIKFFILRDFTGTLQTIIKKENGLIFDQISVLTTESVVEVIGEVKLSKEAPNGVELLIKEFKILSIAEDLPIPVVLKGENKESDQEKRLDYRWIDLRKDDKLLIFKAWTLLEQNFRNYFIENNYTQIHSPKLIDAPSESGAEVFEVKYFDKKVYLAQSPQFYKQMAMASGFERVFEIGPVFRAEPSFTSRHATEFTGFDIEVSYIRSEQDVISEIENFIIRVLKDIKAKIGEEILEKYNREVIVPQKPFPQIPLLEAKEILNKLKVKSEKVDDLSPEEEKAISKYVKEKHNSQFLFLTNYPITVRPFYHMRREDNKKITKSFDLLYNGLEMLTGAQREHRANILLEQAKEKGVNLQEIGFYLDFFRYGCPPHGGFGFGPARFIMKLLDLDNIREATYLYRGVRRTKP